MAKRPHSELEKEDSYLGFVHALSPMKISRMNSKYFDFTIQTATSNYKKVVCFDATKRNIMDSAAKSKSPIRMTNVTEQFSKITNKSDVIVNSKSKIDVVKKLDFSHHPPSESDTRQLVKEKDLSSCKILPERSLVSVTAKIAKIEEAREEIIFGKPLKCQDIIVVDATSNIKLVLWGDLVSTVSLDKTYQFTNASVRSFNQQIYLSTTKACKIVEKEDLVDYVYYQQETNNKKSGEIVQVKVIKTFVCKSCTKKNNDIDINEKFNRCHFCNMLQKTSSFIQNLQAVVNVEFDDSETHPSKLTIKDNAITKLFMDTDKQEILNNHQKMEEFFLENKFNFEIKGEFVEKLDIET